MTLTESLEQQARKRGLIAPNKTVTAASVFALVRDMPHQRASAGRPESIIKEWRGTCSGKTFSSRA